MKPSNLGAGLVVAVALALLLAPSLGLGSTPPAAPAPIPTASILEAAGPDLPPETPTTAPTQAPIPTATPQPPQVIYVQLPPQTIYVEAPRQNDTSAAATPAGATPACHPSYTGVCLDAGAVDYDCIGTNGDGPSFTPGPFRVAGEDVFLLDPDFNGIACDLPATATPPSTATLVPTGTPTHTPTATRTPAPTRTPRPTATPVLARGQVVVNFAGAPIEKPTSTVSFAVEPGRKAWDAIRGAIGVSNLAYQDFGGDLGIFITGFYGVAAQGNHFWEFFVNGRSSSVGVSVYTVGDGDILEFRYSSF